MTTMKELESGLQLQAQNIASLSRSIGSVNERVDRVSCAIDNQSRQKSKTVEEIVDVVCFIGTVAVIITGILLFSLWVINSATEREIIEACAGAESPALCVEAFND